MPDILYIKDTSIVCTAGAEYCGGFAAVSESMLIREVLLLAGFRVKLQTLTTAAHGICKGEGGSRMDIGPSDPFGYPRCAHRERCQ